MERGKVIIFLFIILFIASFLRLEHLNDIPFDVKASNEIDHFEKTWEKSYLFFATTWDNFYHLHATPTFYPSLLALSQDLFGHTKFALRIISALSGIITTLLIFIFCKDFLHSRQVGLFSAFLFALSPLAINLNQDGELESFIVLLMFVSIFLFLKKQWFKSAMFFGLCLGTKIIGFFLIPLYIIYTIYSKQKINWSKVIGFFAIGFVFMVLANPYPFITWTSLDVDNPQLDFQVPLIVKQAGLKGIKHYSFGGLQAYHWLVWNDKYYLQRDLPSWYYLSQLDRIIPIGLLLITFILMLFVNAKQEFIPTQPIMFLVFWLGGMAIVLLSISAKMGYYLYGLIIPFIILFTVAMFKVFGGNLYEN